MRDAVIASMRQLAETWAQTVHERRKVASVDVAADAIAFCASELVSELARIDEATRLLSVEQFAKAHHTTVSTVRRWCARGELAAEKTPMGDWRIPRNARRETKQRHLKRAS